MLPLLLPRIPEVSGSVAAALCEDGGGEGAQDLMREGGAGEHHEGPPGDRLGQASGDASKERDAYVKGKAELAREEQKQGQSGLPFAD